MVTPLGKRGQCAKIRKQDTETGLQEMRMMGRYLFPSFSYISIVTSFWLLGIIWSNALGRKVEFETEGTVWLSCSYIHGNCIIGNRR